VIPIALAEDEQTALELEYVPVGLDDNLFKPEPLVLWITNKSIYFPKTYPVYRKDPDPLQTISFKDIQSAQI